MDLAFFPFVLWLFWQYWLLGCEISISDYYMQESACIATQYMPIRVLCTGMYCGMYCGMYWWYVLNTYQHVFNTNSYTRSNTDQYKHHRPMHTSLFSILAFLYANTGIVTVKSGAPARTAAPSSTGVPQVFVYRCATGI